METLDKWGYGGNMLALIKNMYQGSETKVIQGNNKSDTIKLRVGLKQGCVLSPLLFSIYIMELGHRLENSGHGVNIGGLNIPALFFADDIVFLGSDEKDLNKLLEIVGCFGAERKLEFISKKSKVMVNWRKGNKDIKWCIGRKVVREMSDYHKIEFGECEEYKYLGVVISIRGAMLKRHEAGKLANNKRMAGRVRTFCRGSLNQAFCAKIVWERIVCATSLYGVEAIANSK